MVWRVEWGRFTPVNTPHMGSGDYASGKKIRKINVEMAHFCQKNAQVKNASLHGKCQKE